MATVFVRITCDLKGKSDSVYIEKGSTQLWYRNGKLHREGGPAVKAGYMQEYWYRDGWLHREDGPAVRYEDGSTFWYLNGNYHRINGPAIEYSNGAKLWYVNGKQCAAF